MASGTGHQCLHCAQTNEIIKYCLQTNEICVQTNEIKIIANNYTSQDPNIQPMNVFDREKTTLIKFNLMSLL